MIVNVNEYDFSVATKNIRGASSGAGYAERSINSAISDSKLHMSTCSDKVANRIGKWERTLSELKSRLSSLKSEEASLKSEIATLKSRISDLKSRIASLKSEIDSVRSRISSVQSQLASLRPPRKVSYSYTDSNGNNRTETYIEDPDAGRRAALQAELASLQARLSELTSKMNELQHQLSELLKKLEEKEKRLEEVQRQIELVKEDIESAKEYIELMKETREQITKAKHSLEETAKYVSDATDSFISDCDGLESSIDELRACIERYNATSYVNAEFRGSTPYIKSPELSSASFGAGAYVGATTGRNTSSNAQKPPKPALPPKMKLKSESERIVDVIGKYDDKTELDGDIDKVRQILGAKITLRIKKPVSGPVPCFENLKALADFLESKGFHGKMTAMGTRYTDGEGCLIFIG